MKGVNVAIPGIEENIGALLEKAARRYGKNKAIHFDHENWGFTYSQLNARVNQYANALQVEGVKKGDHVAVMLPNCPEFPVAWLALAKLGAVMVPLNNRYQAVDLEYVLNSHPKILSAAVIPVPDESRGEEVKAYISPAQGETPESIPPEDIIAFCLERIAEFKVPRYIEYVDEFQRTASGKIQKHALIGAKEDLTADCYDRMAAL